MKPLLLTKSLYFLLTIGLMVSPFSCEDEEIPSQQEEAEYIDELFRTIEDMANSVDCVNAEEWLFTPFGSKACGGPVGYIAYSSSIDTVAFLQFVEDHRAQQQAFNEKWNIMSDCSSPLEPTGVVCENGNPVFTYD